MSLSSSTHLRGLIASLLCLYLLSLRSSLSEKAASSDDALSLHRPNNHHLQRRQEIPNAADNPLSATDAGLSRFQQVNTEFFPQQDNSKPLYRSSAPFYDGVDSSQKYDVRTAKFLQSQGIKTVISLNSHAVSPNFFFLYKGHDVVYVSVPVVDFKAPTVREMDKVWEAYKSNRHRGGTVIWCGFGHGRTGTAICALEIRAQAEKPRIWRTMLDERHFKTHHVETPEQLKQLTNYQDQVTKQCPK
ncbi:hypothetical protein CP532_4528 [Ophiocordyceps camponoti-leonardi (nom. inval.)]|nr:hypothetical protein CP532_4528 [Ophiocordyceps camponoti-leonardi (nom. inval.)]